jgi:hypothetical protein
MIKQLALEMISKEHDNAIAKFPAFYSAHEGMAVLEEEFLELRQEVFKNHEVRNIENMRKEASQIAAMALRFMIDCT